MDAEAFVGFRQVPAARYGGLMATTAALPRRIHAFVRWVVRTPWPLFSLSMLQSDIIGALFVLGFLRYGLPPQDNIQLQDLPPVNLLIFVSTVIILFLAGAVVNLKLLIRSFDGSAATTCSPSLIRPPPSWPAAAHCACRCTAL